MRHLVLHPLDAAPLPDDGDIPMVDANKPFYLLDEEDGHCHLIEIERYSKTGYGEYGMYLTIKANVVRPKITTLDDPNLIDAPARTVEPAAIEASGWIETSSVIVDVANRDEGD